MFDEDLKHHIEKLTQKINLLKKIKGKYFRKPCKMDFLLENKISSGSSNMTLITSLSPLLPPL